MSSPIRNTFWKGFHQEIYRQWDELATYKSAALLTIGTVGALTLDLFLKGSATRLMTKWSHRFFVTAGIFSSAKSAYNASQGDFHKSGQSAAKALLSFGMACLIRSPLNSEPPAANAFPLVNFFGSGPTAFATAIVVTPFELSWVGAVSAAAALPPGILLMKGEGDPTPPSSDRALLQRGEEMLGHSERAIHASSEGKKHEAYSALCQALACTVEEENIGVLHRALLKLPVSWNGEKVRLLLQ